MRKTAGTRRRKKPITSTANHRKTEFPAATQAWKPSCQ